MSIFGPAPNTGTRCGLCDRRKLLRRYLNHCNVQSTVELCTVCDGDPTPLIESD